MYSHNNRESEEFAAEELRLMGISCDKIQLIREKDGIALFRVFQLQGSLVLKLFLRTEFAREIDCYRILQKARIPTIQTYSFTNRAILMEDLSASAIWRLGCPADLNDPKIAGALARWYRQLHETGKNIVQANTLSWYSETDILTIDNLEHAIIRTGTEHSGVWNFVRSNLEPIQQLIARLESTLNYNDFYYTNMAVRHDGTAAMMFDYNFVGKGYVAADIRNVCVSMGSEARDAFCDAYGAISKTEIQIDRVVSALVTVILGTQREPTADWAKPSIDYILSGDLKKDLTELLTTAL